MVLSKIQEFMCTMEKQDFSCNDRFANLNGDVAFRAVLTVIKDWFIKNKEWKTSCLGCSK